MLKPFLTKEKIEAGIDESGRGALAGPVIAAAVIFPKNFYNNEINDSKIISKKKRIFLENIIKENAIAYSIGIVSVKEIDKTNILSASFLAMHQAIKNLNKIPELLLVDGNSFTKFPKIPHQCIIKGDNKYLSIAAASILAKNYRDRIMFSLDNKNRYNWKKNKGYPTKEHRNLIKKIGISSYHRKSFKLLKKAMIKSS